MWVWGVVGLASFFVLFGLLLSVPVDAVVHLDTSAERRFRFRMVWLFGLVGKEFGLKKPKPQIPKRATARRKRKFPIGKMWRILHTRGFLTKIKNLMCQVLSRVKIKEVAVALKFGLEDPADAGLAFAVIGAARPFIRLPPQCELTIEPSFTGQSFFNGYCRGVLSLQPIRLVIPFTRFILSRPTLRVLRVLVSSRRKS